MTTATKPEPYLQPKELADALTGHGLPGWTPRACRMLVRAMVAGGAPAARGRYVRASDAAVWLVANPNWQPFARRCHTPSLSATLKGSA